MALQRCKGDTWKWCGQLAAGTVRSDQVEEPKPVSAQQENRQHRMVVSGTVHWCRTCGSFAESKAIRLRHACRGPPPKQLGSGGLRQQLEKLRQGVHPVSGNKLPDAKLPDGSPVVQVHGYARLQAKDGRQSDPLFAAYVPEVLPAPVMKEQVGRTAKEKAHMRLIKIRLRQRRKAKQVK